MAISIDTVYQKVLAIANKEQRGYINPQQFNLFANQAQMDIFEDYFFKLNQVEFGQKNSTQYADIKNILLEKIQNFEKRSDLIYSQTGENLHSTFTFPSDLYRLGSVKYLTIGSNLCTDPNFNDTSGNNLITGNSNAFTFSSGSDLQSSGLSTSTWYATDTSISISGGKLTFTDTIDPRTAYIAYDFNPHKTYKITFTLSNFTKGGFGFIVNPGASWNYTTGGVEYGYYASLNIQSANNVPVNPNEGIVRGNGTHTFIVKPSRTASASWVTNPLNQTTNGTFHFKSVNCTSSSDLLSCQVDDVKIQEVGNEWTIRPENSWQFGDGHDAQGFQTEYPDQSGNRLNKAWGNDDLSGNALESAGYIENAMSLVEGNTYSITYTVDNATAGKLYLGNHLAESIIGNELDDGTNDNMVLFDASNMANGKYTKYWVQGSSNTTKLSIFRQKVFDGSITNIIVRQVAAETEGYVVEQVRGNDITYLLSSKLAKPTLKRPVYIKGENGINVYPKSIQDGISANYIRKPNKVEWNYTEVNSVALYNSSTSTDFELHDSEENTLVIKILALAGIGIKDGELLQVALAKEAETK